MQDLYRGNFNNKKRLKFSDKKEVEPQEIFLDNLAQKESEKNNFSNNKIEVPLSKSCFYVTLLFAVLLFSTLFSRSFYLQVIKGEEFIGKAERNRFAFSSVQSSRGVIYDKNMDQLVFNRPIFSLVVNKKELPEDGKEATLIKLADIINTDYRDLKKEIEESDASQFIVLSDLDREDLIALEIKTRDLVGIEIEQQLVRHYEQGEIFGHLIGYIGEMSLEEIEESKEGYFFGAQTGKMGLEKSYEETLRIVPGKIRTERDARGESISEEQISMPQSGNSLVLTIDAGLQKTAYSALEKTLENIGSKSAAVVATDPETGEVLSLVSFPGFNNNVFSLRDRKGIIEIFEDSSKPLFNRAISGLYPVGSSIKPFMAAAALQEGIVTASDQFYSSGSISIPNPWDPSRPSVFRDWQAHGWVDLKRAIAVSSNVYFYIIGGGYEDQEGLGATLTRKYLELFGWGLKTGIDLPNEKGGFVPYPEWKTEKTGEPWRTGDSYNLSIGQGDLSVTPLQVTYAYNAIANGGKLMKPMLVKKVLDEEGQIIEIKEKETVEKISISPENIEKARQGMRDAVVYGSATVLGNLPVEAAAKTGTAQIPKAGHYHNWVSVFAPYDDPEIVLTVMIEEVEGIRAASLPVAREILEYYFGEK